MHTVQVGAQGAYAPTEFWGKEIWKEEGQKGLGEILKNLPLIKKFLYVHATVI